MPVEKAQRIERKRIINDNRMKGVSSRKRAERMRRVSSRKRAERMRKAPERELERRVRSIMKR